MKTFEFTYLDKQGNTLKTETKQCFNKTSALAEARIIRAYSMMNDLYKINVKLIK